MIRASQPKEIIFYRDIKGKVPLKEWLFDLKDEQARRRIISRLFNIEQGHYGDFKKLSGKEGLLEFRFDFGPGYRIYFGEYGNTMVILLAGGDKKTQGKDIARALEIGLIIRRINVVRHYPTLNEVVESYFQEHPEEIEPYLSEIFEEYALSGDSASLLASLRVIARVKGISVLADETGMTRQGLQKALSAKGNPRLDNINSIMHALGYRLAPRKLITTKSRA